MPKLKSSIHTKVCKGAKLGDVVELETSAKLVVTKPGGTGGAVEVDAAAKFDQRIPKLSVCKFIDYCG